jgi:site-specific DNA-cytosine methylase
LFSGIGALDLAIESLLGVSTSILCERDPYARRILARHWPDVPLLPDVRDVGDVGADVVFGGPPCQAISVAGKQLGDADPRFLWPEAVRIVGANRPRIALWENPTALLSHDNGRTFARHVLQAFDAIGYACQWDSAEAAAAGAPHRRDRAWIVCVPHATFTRPTPPVSRAVSLFGHAEPDPEWPRAGWYCAGKCGEERARWPRGSRPVNTQAQGWPTPRCGEGGNYPESEAANANRGGAGLATIAATWPTPRSEDAEQSGARVGRGVADTLTSAARTWPTPCQGDEKNTRNATANRDGSKGGEGRGVIGQTLCDAVEIEGGKHPGTWPTPQAHDQKGKPGVASLAHAGLASSLPASVEAAANWPTPDTMGDRFVSPRADANGKHAMSLHHAVAESWATPKNSDHRSGKASPETLDKNSRPLQEQAWEASDKPAAVGALNPAFSEFLMGVPPGWTEPDGPPLDHVPAGWDGPLTYYGGRPAPEGMALLTTEKKDRRDRLRCLGNAVVAKCALMAFGALLP